MLQASEVSGGVLSAVMHSDGSGGDLLSLPGGGSHLPATESTVRDGKHFIHMDGREVFRFATRAMGQAAQEALDQAGLTTQDVQWIIPHQANLKNHRDGRPVLEDAPGSICDKRGSIRQYLDSLDSDRHGGGDREPERSRTGTRLSWSDSVPDLTWGALAAEWTGALPSEKPIDVKRYQQLGSRSLVFAAGHALYRRPHMGTRIHEILGRPNGVRRTMQWQFAPSVVNSILRS